MTAFYKTAPSGSLWRRTRSDMYSYWIDPGIKGIAKPGVDFFRCEDSHLILMYLGITERLPRFRGWDDHWSKFIIGEKVAWIIEDETEWLQMVS